MNEALTSKQLRHRFVFTLITLMSLFGSCKGIDSSPAAVATSFLAESPAPLAGKTARRIFSPPNSVSSLDINFGWLVDGRIYYGFYNPSTEGGSKWYIFDPVDSTAGSLEAPYPGVKAEFFRQVVSNNNIEITAISASPSGEVLLYTQIPNDYAVPKTAGPDFFPPQELWFARNHEEPILLFEDFAYQCGYLESQGAHWIYNETLYLGSCLSYIGGLESYFTIDIQRRAIRFVRFPILVGTPEGSIALRYAGDLKGLPGNVEQAGTPFSRVVNPFSVAMAHESPSITFVIHDEFDDALNGLWMIPVEQGGRDIPLDIGKAVLLARNASTYPLWSSDDRWVYYWRIVDAPITNSGGKALYPWRLERINVQTQQQEMVLSQDDLHSMIGDKAYELEMDSVGAIHRWALSADGHHALWFSTPLKTLYLFSW